MADPYQPPPYDAERSQAPSVTPSPILHGLIYTLLFPVAAAYTIIARSIAGPGYTTAPNQGAMVLFFLFCLAWPIVAIVVIGIIRRFSGVRGLAASAVGVLSWLCSCYIPFWIGMD
ncbi:hypothetical protein [Crateriforma conspicua]|uniref:hypothetical protein n=1 Tax=Crateriforma conspicua TaxID=2527996 RepID=UPI0011A04DF6|nr:hypothetical protein [Crateriforma conspicua]